MANDHLLPTEVKEKSEPRASASGLSRSNSLLKANRLSPESPLADARGSESPLAHARGPESFHTLLRARIRVLRRLGIFVFIVALIATVTGIFLLTSPAPPVPSFPDVKNAYRASDARLLDRNHVPLQELRIDKSGRKLEWIPLSEISPAMLAAVVHAEDRKFYRHHGVDWLAFPAALKDVLAGRVPRGASTITMQVASMVAPGSGTPDSRRSVARKWRQICLALSLEKKWSKTEILEAYLNLVSFRGELQGIAAASRGLFRKEPHGLNAEESLVLSALVRGPNAREAQVSSRARALARSLGLRFDDHGLAGKARQASARSYYIEPKTNLAPHVAEILFREYQKGDSQNSAARSGASLQIVSTLDEKLQRYASEVLRHHVAGLVAQNVHDGAVLVIENRSGDVLAYAGNTGDLALARYVDGVKAPRQAGSTLKPFLYGLAFDRRLMTPASLIDDSPVDIVVAGGVFRPKNYDNRFNGLVSARTALASSLNVPAVQTLNNVGVESFLQILRQLEFQNLQQPDFYGPSLALGSADITLWDLTNAYRSLANNGVWSKSRLLPQTEDRAAKRIYSEQAAFLVSSILSDRESRSKTFSLENPLSTRFWTAVKTGTSKDMRDNWCVGYSSDYTVGVWVGNFSGAPMWNVSGISGAAPVWVEIMNWLHADKPSLPKTPPAGVVVQITEFPELGQSRKEWFIQGTEVSLVEPAPGNAHYKITYPVEGTLIALDPDIPEEEQRMFFESRPRDPSLQWQLDGNSLGDAGSLVPWKPVAGKHTITLMDSKNQALDSVSFEVRGAAPAILPGSFKNLNREERQER
ncbi:MAG TPA: penicillin-binding protein 1C [Acidobacteriota bacterium]|jgi:penicillin-binding protein 1C